MVRPSFLCTEVAGEVIGLVWHRQTRTVMEEWGLHPSSPVPLLPEPSLLLRELRRSLGGPVFLPKGPRGDGEELRKAHDPSPWNPQTGKLASEPVAPFHPGWVKPGN